MALVAALLAVCHSLQILKSTGSIAVLTGENWDAKIERRRSNETWFVMFYAESCGGSKFVAPEFALASKETYGLVQFAGVNLTAETGLAERFNIAHTPAFTIYHSAGTNDFTGGRTAEQFLNAVAQYYPGCFKNFDADWFKEWEDSAVLFLYNDRIPLSWKIFSCRYPNIRVGFSTDGHLRHSLGAPLAPAPFLVNATHKVQFRDIPTAIESSEAFFQGTYVKPKPVLEFFLPFEIGAECRHPAPLCIGLRSDGMTPEFRELAEEYFERGFKFFQGDVDWPTRAIEAGKMALFKPGSRFCYPVPGRQTVREAIAEALTDSRKLPWVKY